MSATFEFEEDNGAATGSGVNTKGTTRTAARTENNWKNIDDSTTAYSAQPITAGNNSYDKWQFGHFSGTYNQILSGLWAHTAGTALDSHFTIKGKAGANSNTYTTPAVSANAALTVDMTSAIAIGSGQAVLFGGANEDGSHIGPEGSSKAASTTSNPAYTQWLVTQLQTTSGAPPGDIPSQTLTLQYQEN